MASQNNYPRSKAGCVFGDGVNECQIDQFDCRIGWCLKVYKFCRRTNEAFNGIDIIRMKITVGNIPLRKIFVENGMRRPEDGRTGDDMVPELN